MGEQDADQSKTLQSLASFIGTSIVSIVIAQLQQDYGWRATGPCLAVLIAIGLVFAKRTVQHQGMTALSAILLWAGVGVFFGGQLYFITIADSSVATLSAVASALGFLASAIGLGGENISVDGTYEELRPRLGWLLAGLTCIVAAGTSFVVSNGYGVGVSIWLAVSLCVVSTGRYLLPIRTGRQQRLV